MNDILSSIAFRLASDPGFFVPYLLIVGAVAIELIRRTFVQDSRRRCFLALVLYPLLIVLIAILFLTLQPPSTYYSSYNVEESVSPANVRFGDKIELVGYTIADPTVQAGEPVRLTLYWRSTGYIPVDYNTFVHLVAADGTLVVQGDHSTGGDLSTTYWLPGELVEDEHSLALPAGTPPAQYSIVVGLYQWWDGERLPAQSDGERIPFDAFFLPESVSVLEDES